MDFCRGQKVVLNNAGLQYKYLSGGAPSRKHKQWRGRVGTIAALSRYRDRKYAFVIWDGNKTRDDAIPIDFLEHA